MGGVLVVIIAGEDVCVRVVIGVIIEEREGSALFVLFLLAAGDVHLHNGTGALEVLEVARLRGRHCLVLVVQLAYLELLAALGENFHVKSQ